MGQAPAIGIERRITCRVALRHDVNRSIVRAPGGDQLDYQLGMLRPLIGVQRLKAATGLQIADKHDLVRPRMLLRVAGLIVLDSLCGGDQRVSHVGRGPPRR